MEAYISVCVTRGTAVTASTSRAQAKVLARQPFVDIHASLTGFSRQPYATQAASTTLTDEDIDAWPTGNLLETPKSM